MRPETPFMMMPISRTLGAGAVDAAAGAGARVVVSDTVVPFRSVRSLVSDGAGKRFPDSLTWEGVVAQAVNGAAPRRM